MQSEFPSLPANWSGLTWQQLTVCWEAKIRYGGKPDVARAAALLAILSLGVCSKVKVSTDGMTGEDVYSLSGNDGSIWAVTPRELSQLAKQALPWFDYPYGDPGDPAEKDEKGKVVRDPRDPVPGYVNPNFSDALALPKTELNVDGIMFALPQVACNNITWQQYRSIQATASQLFAADISEEQAIDMQAQFLAHILVPGQPANRLSDRFTPDHIFRYDAERAEQAVAFWNKKLSAENEKSEMIPSSTLFHICLQTYQTAMLYYEKVYPLLFSGNSKSDPLQDALTGEIGTVNAVMMKANYHNQQEVYDSDLPFIFDILNTMTKEAKEIEKMNAKIKKK